LPMIGVGSQFLHQKMMPATGMDPTQAKILNFMPLLFGFIMIKQGAALSMYMSVQALVGILMQLFINRALSVYDKKLDEELQGA
jgi:YidC/Oxa1 family membrane protein insertase